MTLELCSLISKLHLHVVRVDVSLFHLAVHLLLQLRLKGTHLHLLFLDHQSLRLNYLLTSGLDVLFCLFFFQMIALFLQGMGYCVILLLGALHLHLPGIKELGASLAYLGNLFF